MEHQTRRPCPFCAAAEARPAPPYLNRYGGSEFRYWRCAACATRFIDPVPDADLGAALFDPARYHASYYETVDAARYEALADRIAHYLPPGSRVLDYGCGNGQMLTALAARGFEPVGIELSPAAVANAAARTGCPVHPASSPAWRGQAFDGVHLCDVIGHLADPRGTLGELAAVLRPGGILCVEGAIEANPSLVRAVARGVAGAGRLLRPGRTASFPPFDVNFATGPSQRALFARLGAPLVEREWRIFETGWPYRRNGLARNAVALAAIAASKVPVLGSRLGNKFFAVFERGGHAGTER